MTVTLGFAVHRLRQARGWKQQELARRSGLAQGFISDLERGHKANPTQETLQKLATAFDLPLNEFLQEVGMIVPPVVVELQAQGLAESLAEDLITIWPRLTIEDREALIAMHRSILARYPRDEVRHGANGVAPPEHSTIQHGVGTPEALQHPARGDGEREARKPPVEREPVK